MATRWCALLLLVLAVPAWAEVRLSLPLEGHYRLGRYVPVAVTASLPGSGAEAYLAIQGDGAIETQIALSDGRAEGVAPFLPLSRIRAARWQAQGVAGAGRIETTWRALAPDERLVGFTAVDMEIARQLFADAPIVPVSLEGGDPLPGPAAAWEALDAVVLDSAARLEEEKMALLLGCGTTFAVRRPDRPDSRWPWRQVGAYWVLSHAVVGPRISAEDPGAFAPVQGWRADWPAAFRGRIVLYAVIFCMVAVGVSLIRVRYAPLLVVLVSAIATAALAIWWHGRSPLLERGGQVIVIAGGMAQSDTWRYQASVTPATAAVPWRDVMHPLFEMPSQAREMQMALICRSSGEPAGFQYNLPPAVRCAFLSRFVTTQLPPAGQSPPESSPLLLLARRAYLRRGSQVQGHLPTPPPDDFRQDDSQWWGTLLIGQP